MALLQLFETGNGIKLVNPEELISDSTTLDLTSTRAFSYVTTAPTTFAFQNAPAFGSVTFNMRLTNGGSQPITWPANVNWLGGITPALRIAGDNILQFTSTDGGTTWLGADVSTNASKKTILTNSAQVWTHYDSQLTPINSITLNCVRSANGRIVAVGAGGNITHSADGMNWTRVAASGTTNDFHGVAFGAGLWVAVGAAGTIRTSSDLVTWTTRTSGSTQTLGGIVFAGGQFVAVSQTGTNGLTSPDGITWTLRNTAATTGRITHGNGLYVAVSGAAAGATAYATSPDGITWTSRALPSANWPFVMFDGTNFVTMRNSNSNLLTSPNGLAPWTETNTGNNPSCIAVNSGFYVSGGTAASSTIQTSVNLGVGANSTWTTRLTTPGKFYNDICWSSDAGCFVLVGNNSVLTSSA